MRSEPSRTNDLAPPSPAARPYETPGYEQISLACEISAYAPDGDGPLF